MSPDLFVIETRQGEERTILVDVGTRYCETLGNQLVFEGLAVGRWVAGIAIPTGDDHLLAKLVILLPDDYDPSRRLGKRARGEVTRVDVQTSQFSLHTLRGEDLIFQVNENTIFRGGVSSLAELQTGMVSGVGAVVQEDDSLLALVVLARYRLERFAGEVLEVDQGAGYLLIGTRRDEQVGFWVDENTRFTGKGGNIRSLDDIKTGMLAALLARPDGEGGLLAVGIAAAKRDDFPRFDLKLIGKVETVNQDYFRLVTRDGTVYLLKVDEDTRYRSWRGWVDGIEDLKPGARLFVRVDEGADGSYIARLIVLGRLPR